MTELKSGTVLSAVIRESELILSEVNAGQLDLQVLSEGVSYPIDGLPMNERAVNYIIVGSPQE